MTGRLERHAWAKVNLVLKVVGRRPPEAPMAGYHELESLVVFAGIGDRLEFREAEDLTLVLDGPFAESLAQDPDNLVLRAARALALASGRPARAAITLDKRLPVASGIGGGSADAAAALSGLSALWGLEPDRHALEQLARGLGADVPVCLAGRACRMSGIGEVVEPLVAPPAGWLVLASPGLALATPAVFARRTGDFSRPFRWPAEGFATLEDLAHFVRLHGNDLLVPAAGLCPPIGQVLAALEATGPAAAGLSGSGATCFALFADQAAAETAARRLAAAEPSWWVVAAPLLS